MENLQFDKSLQLLDADNRWNWRRGQLMSCLAWAAWWPGAEVHPGRGR